MNTFDSDRHHRKSIRLKGYDYSRLGVYFITICCQDKKCLFGEIRNGLMVLNEYGTVAADEWAKLPERFEHIELGEHVVMPNHMHGIIAINPMPKTNATVVGAGLAPALSGCTPTPVSDNETRLNNYRSNPCVGVVSIESNATTTGDTTGAGASPAPTTVVFNATIGDMVGAYKSLVTNECLKSHKQKWAGLNAAPAMGKIWQRNYYEHIIRNHESFQQISLYIINNPSNWETDKLKG